MRIFDSINKDSIEDSIKRELGLKERKIKVWQRRNLKKESERMKKWLNETNRNRERGSKRIVR